MLMEKPQFGCLAVVGVGLIGGSVALACKSRGLADKVLGIGRNPARLAEAQEQGIIDGFASDATALQQADLVVVCTPVDRIAGDVLSALSVTDSHTLVTDAGSVKAAIVQAVDERGAGRGDRFVGAHPLAGSHAAGFEHADPNLYAGRLCVVTPGNAARRAAVDVISAFWNALGMRVRELSPQEHDRVLALTSHLPHLAAAAVAGLVAPEYLEFASTGYRDTTRIAAGDPELWSAIFTLNAQPVMGVTDQLIASLQEFRRTLAHGSRDDLIAYLRHASEQRRCFRDGSDAVDAS